MGGRHRQVTHNSGRDAPKSCTIILFNVEYNRLDLNANITYPLIDIHKLFSVQKIWMNNNLPGERARITGLV